MKALVAVALVLVAAGVAFFISTSPTVPPAEMTGDLEANKQLVRDMFSAIDAQDYDRIAELWPDDALARVVGTVETINEEPLLDMIRGFYQGFPDYTHEIDAIIAEGDWVAVMLTFRATHQAEFEGIPATGNAVTYGGGHFVRFEDGVVKEWWFGEDNLALMQQIGMQLVPVEEG